MDTQQQIEQLKKENDALKAHTADLHDLIDSFRQLYQEMALNNTFISQQRNRFINELK